jgi:hypothetical protein
VTQRRAAYTVIIANAVLLLIEMVVDNEGGEWSVYGGVAAVAGCQLCNNQVVVVT